MMIAQFIQHEIQVCTRLNAKRPIDFTKGKRLGKVICEAAAFGGVLPRRLSFTRTCVFLLEMGRFLALSGVQGDLKSILKHLAKMVVPDRPGRYEPRMVKRRLDKYPLMKKPRHEMKNDVNLVVFPFWSCSNFQESLYFLSFLFSFYEGSLIWRGEPSCR
jgi:hypothetical protein